MESLRLDPWCRILLRRNHGNCAAAARSIRIVRSSGPHCDRHHSLSFVLSCPGSIPTTTTVWIDNGSPDPPPSLPEPYEIPVALAWGGAIAVLVLTVTALIPPGRFEAALVAYRLRHLATGPGTLAAHYERLLRQTSGNPSSVQSSEAARKIIASAQSNDVRIDTAVLKETAAKFLEVADKNPDAWGAAAEFLAYQSFLNRDRAPLLARTTDCSSEYQSNILLDFAGISGPDLQNFRPTPSRPLTKIECVRGANLPTEKTARLELLGAIYNYPGIPKDQQGRPPGENKEIAFYRISVGWNVALVLDNTRLKNVVVENTVVEYRGGPSF